MVSEKLLGAKIDEIDATPLRWKLLGIGFVAFVMASGYVEIPLPLFPDPVFAELGVTAHAYAGALLLLSPLLLALGVYAGFVSRKIMTGFNEESE